MRYPTVRSRQRVTDDVFELRPLLERQSFHEVHRGASTARASSSVVSRPAGAVPSAELDPQAFVYRRRIAFALFDLLERVDRQGRRLAELQNIWRRVAPDLIEGVGTQTWNSRAAWASVL